MRLIPLGVSRFVWAQYQSFLFEKNWPKTNVLFPLPRLWVRKLKDYFNKRKRNYLSPIVLNRGWHKERQKDLLHAQ